MELCKQLSVKYCDLLTMYLQDIFVKVIKLLSARSEVSQRGAYQAGVSKNRVYIGGCVLLKVYKWRMPQVEDLIAIAMSNR